MAVKLETKASLENLKDILVSLLPTSVEVFNNVVLELLQDGVEREFLVNQEFTRDNLIALVIDKSEKPRQKIILFCYPETNRNLKDFLQTNLNFKIPLLFGGITLFQQEVVQSLYGDRTPDWSTTCHIMLDWQKRQDDPLSEVLDQKYRVEKISQEHATLVDNNWKFRNSLSMQMVEGLIQQEKLLGLFLPDANEPVSWITIYSYGSMGMLFTREDYRRRGLAKILVKAARDYTRSLGLVPYVHVENDNTVSARFFDQLGFTKDQYAVWAGYD